MLCLVFPAQWIPRASQKKRLADPSSSEDDSASYQAFPAQHLRILRNPGVVHCGITLFSYALPEQAFRAGSSFRMSTRSTNSRIQLLLALALRAHPTCDADSHQLQSRALKKNLSSSDQYPTAAPSTADASAEPMRT